EEVAEDDGAEQEPGGICPRDGADAEDPERHEGVGDALLPEREAGEESDGDGEQPDRSGGAPAHDRRARERVDEQRETAGDRDGAEDVGPPLEADAALADEPPREHERAGSDRDVDEEDPLPAEVLRQHAAREDADCGAGAADRAPDPERLVSLGALIERRRDDRERGRRDDRGPEALDCARADEDAFRPREATEKRRSGEDGDPDHEDAPAPEQIRRSA